jgi:phenylacetate-coenzyme A ligase PaaK-like adenylate-forming protein
MSNPFLNPVFTMKALKSYLLDINRLWKISPKKLKRFQDKNFRKAVKYAYTVPLYHDKYKEANIHPNDIRGIDDLKFLS